MTEDAVAELAVEYLRASARKGQANRVATLWLDLKEAAGGHRQALAALVRASRPSQAS